ncbi:hypothetical protein [Sanguibacter antarcticus]|uniref:Glutaminase n=1 Tax=Sanguibacter antarcticus TaxID=372484 RepID=A0A2A9E6L6_9MICO|nr:hypothetical protein [Sanguibacter antarcticus]PFG34697.1 hypothetical protein ATL42_2617 [Sanguibacter antarcticus]
MTSTEQDPAGERSLDHRSRDDSARDDSARDDRALDDRALDDPALDDRALDDLRAVLVRAVERLEAAGARDEALAVLVEPRPLLGLTRPAVLRGVGRAWRLGALMLGADGTLYATGALVRAREAGVRNHQSASAEARRDLRAAALRGKFGPGETVNYGWRELALDAAAVRSGDGPLVFAPDGTLAVRWNAALGDAAARDVVAYLDERVRLLVEPLDVP